MKFEIGKYYQHGGNGVKMSILGVLNTTMWGNCLIGETNTSELRPVGKDETSATNWREIEKSEWLKEFSK